MDLDDLLDGPKKGPTRSTRFAPKGSKFQPKTELSSSSASASLLTAKKDDIDDKAKMKPQQENSAVDMDVELNPNVEEMEVPDDSMETEAAEGVVGPGDEVVREIDVYFAPSIDPETQVYSYFSVFFFFINFVLILYICFCSSFWFADEFCNSDENPIMMHFCFFFPGIPVAVSA